MREGHPDTDDVHALPEEDVEDGEERDHLKGHLHPTVTYHRGDAHPLVRDKRRRRPPCGTTAVVGSSGAALS